MRAVAHLDREPVGWCSMGPHQGVSRALAAGTIEAAREQGARAVEA